MKEIYLVGGCFWGLEAYFKLLKGVIDTDVGYANGNKKNPKYEELKQGKATHAETVKIVYDDSKLTLYKILDAFMEVIDPYSINKQGNDEGLQYRSGIYLTNESELSKVKEYIANKENELNKGKFVIEISLLQNYYSAEEYHQDYLDKNPSGYCHINLNKYR